MENTLGTTGAAVTSPVPIETPPGGYFVMMDHEKSADHCDTLTLARKNGQAMCDAEPLPTSWSIYDADGKFVEDITRSDGRSLSDMIRDFK